MATDTSKLRFASVATGLLLMMVFTQFALAQSTPLISARATLGSLINSQSGLKGGSCGRREFTNVTVSRYNIAYDYSRSDNDGVSQPTHVNRSFLSLRPVHAEQSFFHYGGWPGVQDEQGPLDLPGLECFVGFEGNHLDVDKATNAAEQFSQALNKMIEYVKVDAPREREEKDAAAGQCSSPVERSALGESAKSEFLAATEYVNEKSFDDAFDHFESLTSDAPCFADGQFNAALVAGELGYYADAISYMKRYIALKPNAADTDEANAKIMVWQDHVVSAGSNP